MLQDRKKLSQTWGTTNTSNEISFDYKLFMSYAYTLSVVQK